MEVFDWAAQVVSAAVFVAIAIRVFAQWQIRRDAPSAWLALTFGALGAVLVVALVAPDEPDGVAGLLLTKLLLLGIVLYPWLLFRFTAAFDRPPGWLRWVAALVSAGAIAATIALPEFPGDDEARPAWFQLYALLVIAEWAFLSVVVAARLWRAGTGHASVTRLRMRLMAVASVMLALAILPGASSGDRPDAVEVVTSLLPLLSGVAFFLGFAPPAWLRTVWRRPDQEALRDAELELMSVVDADAVASAMLPHIARVFGGRSAMTVDVDGRPSAVHGMTEMQAREIAVPLASLSERLPVVLDGSPGVLASPLAAGWLAVPATEYTPFFGGQELSLLQELAGFADLALQRADLLERDRQTRRHLERVNTELETLLYGVSHDLKSPLISLTGYLEYLRADHASSLDEEGVHYVERMAACAGYMQELIQDLLELSRVGRVQTEPADVDLDDLIERVAADLQGRHPELVVATSALPVVRLNPVRARQLVTNLLENAVRHAGRPDVRMSVSAASSADGHVEVSFVDNGVGIPDPYREKVFGVFERLDAQEAGSSGTGVGLAMCRKIVEQVGGSIVVAPSPVGADIRVVLPLTTPFGLAPAEQRASG